MRMKMASILSLSWNNNLVMGGFLFFREDL